MTTLNQIGNGTGYIYVVDATASITDSYPNTLDNWRKTRIRAALYRTNHVEAKAKLGSSQSSKSVGVTFYVDADAGAVMGTVGVTALDVTQIIQGDDRNTLQSVTIASGIVTLARQRPLTVARVAPEAGLADTLDAISVSNPIDGDIILLVSELPTQAITLTESGNIRIRDAGSPIVTSSDTIALVYVEASSTWREIWRNVGRLKSRVKFNAAPGGASLAITNADVEFILLVINGGNSVLTADNTITLPPSGRAIVQIVFETPVFYSGGELIIEGVTVPQAIAESGLATGYLVYDNTDAVWYSFWQQTPGRSDMPSGNMAQGWQDLTGLVTVEANVSAETLVVRRSLPPNKTAYAQVELFGTITINTTMTHGTLYTVLSDLPAWMRPKDHSPAGWVVPVTRGNKGAFLTYVEVNSNFTLDIRPLANNNLAANDVIHLDRKIYLSDDDL